MAGERAAVTPADHAAALAVVEDWGGQVLGTPSHVTTSAQLVLVGMIAATRADARAEGRAAERARQDRPRTLGGQELAP